MAGERKAGERKAGERKAGEWKAGDWIPVLRKQRVGDTTGSLNRTKWVIIFVDDLPEVSDATELRKLFTKFGVVMDVFIPRKRNKAGMRFGFVRYDCSVAAEMAIQKTNGVWFRDRTLKVKLAEFERKDQFLPRGNRIIGCQCACHGMEDDQSDMRRESGNTKDVDGSNFGDVLDSESIKSREFNERLVRGDVEECGDGENSKSLGESGKRGDVVEEDLERESNGLSLISRVAESRDLVGNGNLGTNTDRGACSLGNRSVVQGQIIATHLQALDKNTVVEQTGLWINEGVNTQVIENGEIRKSPKRNLSRSPRQNLESEMDGEICSALRVAGG
ncbi:hypothetical protein Dimus_030932, partial [Dionaea muscipula]